MKILSWNLNNKRDPRVIPDGLGEMFARLDADVVFLNEFVDGPNRAPFLGSLAGAGYVHQMFSYATPNTNQVFAAARHPFKQGDIAPPTLDVWATSNFLHIQFWHTTLELVGLRVPAYKKAADRHAYAAAAGLNHERCEYPADRLRGRPQP